MLAGLLYCEKKEALKAKLVVKTALSFLFIFTAVVQPHPIFLYYRFLLMGMIFCLGGDVFLALPQEKAFLLGLVSFLLGHVAYVVAFFLAAQVTQWTWIGFILCLILSGGVFLWLRPHLGSMLGPVIAYIVVISAMVVGAWTVIGDPNLALPGRTLIFVGAVSFYFSDIFVARDRFLKNEHLNRLFGLPMYYCGQFLLAFSIGLIV